MIPGYLYGMDQLTNHYMDINFWNVFKKYLKLTENSVLIHFQTCILCNLRILLTCIGDAASGWTLWNCKQNLKNLKNLKL